MPNKLVDIHCHTSMRPFLNNENEQFIFEGFNFKPADKLFGLVQKVIENIAHISLKMQSSFDDMYAGGIRVANVSISPMEIGFGLMNNDWKHFINDYLNIRKFRLWNEKNDNVIAPELINVITGFGITEIQKVTDSRRGQQGMRHYYDDYFVHELKWLLSFDNEESLEKKYKVCFPKNGIELKENLKNNKILNILLSVEGAHSFMSIPPKQHVLNCQKKKHLRVIRNPNLVKEVARSIQHLKQHHDVPVCFVSLCHHFWNGLSGHSRSLAKLIGSIVNQNEGINSGLNINGKQVIEDLARTDYGDGKTYKPILIDIKHLSPKARMDYYFFRRNHSKLKYLPIVCSHTGICVYYDKLKDWHDDIDFSGDANEKGKCYLHEEAINLCREDLVEIYNSKGLIGIQLDEKRIMGALAQVDIKGAKTKAKRKEAYAKTVWANIFAAMSELEAAGAIDLKQAWNLFSIGSDYDGLINHFDDFETAADFNDIAIAMEKVISKKDLSFELCKAKGHKVNITSKKVEELKCKISNKILVKKIFSTNAIDFFVDNL